MYRLCSIKKGTSRQAPFGIWTKIEEGENFSYLPITIQESMGDYFLSRQAGVAEAFIKDLPEDCTNVDLFNALAAAEGLLPWAEHRAQVRAEYFGGDLDEMAQEELVDFDEVTRTGPRL